MCFPKTTVHKCEHVHISYLDICEWKSEHFFLRRNGVPDDDPRYLELFLKCDQTEYPTYVRNPNDCDECREDQTRLAVKEEAVKEEAVKEEAVKEEAVKEEAVKEEAVKEEAVKEVQVKDEDEDDGDDDGDDDDDDDNDDDEESENEDDGDNGDDDEDDDDDERMRTRMRKRTIVILTATTMRSNGCSSAYRYWWTGCRGCWAKPSQIDTAGC
jgi:hypothetical protein